MMISSNLSMIQLSLWLLLCCAQAGYSQQRAEPDRAKLLVEGRVARLFESRDGTQLAEVDLRSVAMAPDPPSRNIRLPAPGDAVFVIIEPRQSISRSKARVVPATGDSIRALLSAGDRGVWTGEGEWFESLSETASADASEAGDRRFERVPSTVEVLGMSCAARLVGGQLGFEVKQVAGASAAKDAGLDRRRITARAVGSQADFLAGVWAHHAQ